jgi:protein TonB
MLTLRLPLATGWGVLLSLVTFWALWSLTNTPIDVGDRIVADRIQFTRLLVDSEVGIKNRDPKPERVQPPDVPVPPQVTVRRGGPTAKVTVQRQTIHVPPPPGPGPGGSDHDATPIIRIDPQYPAPALRRGIEGWVQVQFAVTASGMVRDVVVIDASPAGVFDEDTLKAVRRWRYSPKIEDGIAVERVGLQTVIRFRLPE